MENFVPFSKFYGSQSFRERVSIGKFRCYSKRDSALATIWGAQGCDMETSGDLAECCHRIFIGTFGFLQRCPGIRFHSLCTRTLSLSPRSIGILTCHPAIYYTSRFRNPVCILL